MPVILTQESGPIESPLGNEIPRIPSILQWAAPERNVEYEHLFNRLAWRFEINVTDGDFGFEADTVSDLAQNILYAPLAALERTWAYVYSYLVLFDEVRTNPDVEITPEWSPLVRGAFDLLNWANAGEKQKKRLEWHADLPSPNNPSINPDRLGKTNRFFEGVLAFILLHEVGHIHEGHTLIKNALPQEKQRAEKEADSWAAKWLLDRVSEYSPNEEYRINRATWIVLALSILNLVEYNNRNGLPTSHPPTLERILTFLTDFSPETPGPVARISDFPIYLAGVIAGCQALNLGVSQTIGRFDTLTDRLIELLNRFEEHYRPR